MTCARCGFTLPAAAWRCPACAAPAGEPERPRVDCLAALAEPTMPPGVQGEPVALLGSATLGGLAALAMLRLTEAVAAVKSARAITDGDRDASSVGALRATLSALALIIGAATLVAFFFWLRRVVRNASRIALLRQRFDNAWAVGGWFVPVLNLWRPKQVLNDAWSGSGGGSRTLLDWWWAAFVTGELVVMGIADVMVANASVGGELRGAYRFSAFAALLTAVAAALGALVVRRLTERQSAALSR